MCLDKELKKWKFSLSKLTLPARHQGQLHPLPYSFLSYKNTGAVPTAGLWSAVVVILTLQHVSSC